MAIPTLEEKVKSKKKKSKNLNIVSFEEELIPKNVAQQVLQKEVQEPTKDESKKKKKPKVVSEVEVASLKRKESENADQKVRKPKRKKKNADNVEEKKEPENMDTEEQEEDTEMEQTENSVSVPKKKESIRERKRKKHILLLKEKKDKSELATQQNCLNYLSKWKHSRSHWKFEKLKQIWLQHNMYDSAKIPAEFWESLVDYFNNSKGKARDVILKEALKIIEDGNDEDEDEENKTKLGRARDIIQSLQE